MRGAASVLVLVAGCSYHSPSDVSDGGGDDVADASLPGAADARRVPDATTPPPDATSTVTCPGGQLYPLSHGSSQYRVSVYKLTWLQAEADCESNTPGWSHLVAIDDMNEWTWVATTLRDIPLSLEWYAIGVVRDQGSPSGPWRSVTGGNAFTMWRQGEPNNVGGAEPVVVLDSAEFFLNDPDYGGYLDVTTDATFYFACECDGLPPVNATY